MNSTTNPHVHGKHLPDLWVDTGLARQPAFIPHAHVPVPERHGQYYYPHAHPPRQQQQQCKRQDPPRIAAASPDPGPWHAMRRPPLPQQHTCAPRDVYPEPPRSHPSAHGQPIPRGGPQRPSDVRSHREAPRPESCSGVSSDAVIERVIKRMQQSLNGSLNGCFADMKKHSQEQHEMLKTDLKDTFQHAYTNRSPFPPRYPCQSSVQPAAIESPGPELPAESRSVSQLTAESPVKKTEDSNADVAMSDATPSRAFATSGQDTVARPERARTNAKNRKKAKGRVQSHPSKYHLRKRKPRPRQRGN
ncbi:hypothetical protein KC328_g12185 [Hortaea werneckii]|nr:hypothetical protein KC328_g12185 [Hortaea werneckii]